MQTAGRKIEDEVIDWKTNGEGDYGLITGYECKHFPCDIFSCSQSGEQICQSQWSYKENEITDRNVRNVWGTDYHFNIHGNIIWNR